MNPGRKLIVINAEWRFRQNLLEAPQSVSELMDQGRELVPNRWCDQQDYQNDRGHSGQKSSDGSQCRRQSAPAHVGRRWPENRTHDEGEQDWQYAAP